MNSILQSDSTSSPRRTATASIFFGMRISKEQIEILFSEQDKVRSAKQNKTKHRNRASDCSFLIHRATFCSNHLKIKNAHRNERVHNHDDEHKLLCHKRKFDLNVVEEDNLPPILKEVVVANRSRATEAPKKRYKLQHQQQQHQQQQQQLQLDVSPTVPTSPNQAPQQQLPDATISSSPAPVVFTTSHELTLAAPSAAAISKAINDILKDAALLKPSTVDAYAPLKVISSIKQTTSAEPEAKDHKEELSFFIVPSDEYQQQQRLKTSSLAVPTSAGTTASACVEIDPCQLFTLDVRVVNSFNKLCHILRVMDAADLPRWHLSIDIE